MKTSIKYKRLLVSKVATDGGMGTDFVNYADGAREGTAQFQGSDAEKTEHKNITGAILAAAFKKGSKTINWQTADLDPEAIALLTQGQVDKQMDYIGWQPPVDENTEVRLSISILTANNILISLPAVNLDSYPSMNDDDLHYFACQGTVVLPEKAGLKDFDYKVLTAEGAAKKDFLTFNVEGVTTAGTINTSAHTVTLAGVKSLSTVIPHFTTSLGSFVPGSGKVTDFTKPVIYKLTAADGSTQDWTITLTA